MNPKKVFTPSFERDLCTIHQDKKIPALVKAGWTRHQEKFREASLAERTGRFVQPPIITRLKPTTPPARVRMLRDLFLIAQPAPPSKGGDLPAQSRLVQSYSAFEEGIKPQSTFQSPRRG